mmetsp:Transcript_6638/g.24871  ORF Transcript_6638/g.24871 Transcript_6638/m.24871 type:complete len:252 (-) Transcript_6638:1144-1899(-)
MPAVKVENWFSAPQVHGIGSVRGQQLVWIKSASTRRSSTESSISSTVAVSTSVSSVSATISASTSKSSASTSAAASAAPGLFATVVISGNLSDKIWTFNTILFTLLDQILSDSTVGIVEKGTCLSGVSYTSGTPDSVHVRVHVVWHIVVDNVLDATDIQSTSSHIGGNHNVDLSSLELSESLLTLLLALVSVNRSTAESTCLQVSNNGLAVNLSLYKHEDFVVLWIFLLTKQAHEFLKFVVPRYLDEGLVH